jgi:hypothetical protein
VGFILGVPHIRVFIEIVAELEGLRNSDLFTVVTIKKLCRVLQHCGLNVLVALLFSYSGDLGSILGLETGLMVVCCQHSLHTHEIHEVTLRAIRSFQLFAM